MKTPDEIKKGLECCSKAGRCMHGCPYYSNSPVCTTHKSRDALAYIRQLEEENEKLQRYCDAETDRAAEAHYNMREAEKDVPRWTPVEERRPEGNDDVLVFVKHPISGHCWTQIAHRLSAMALDECDEYDEWWLDGSGEIVRYITHWMPLPEPPEVTKP